MSRWTALVLAGSRPGADPFAAEHGTDLKALIPIGGVPMVARPVAALLGAPQIESVRVLAQQPDRIAAVLPADRRLSVEASGDTIASTLDAILRDPATSFPLLVTTADHALLDQAMISEFCGKAEGADVAVGLVEQTRQILRHVHVAGRILDFWQLIESFGQLLTQAVDVKTHLHQQGFDRTTLLFKHGLHQVRRLNGGMIEADGQGLGVGQG